MEQITRTEYGKIHVWLNSTFGKAVACESSTCEGKSTLYQYALKAGKKHKKLRGNYMTLCKICHSSYDAKHQNKGHVSDTRLSMKLLYKRANEYSRRTDKAYNHQNIIDFLSFVENYEKISNA